eukprot:c30246_g1_i1 orf=126-368(+)
MFSTGSLRFITQKTSHVLAHTDEKSKAMLCVSELLNRMRENDVSISKRNYCSRLAVHNWLEWAFKLQSVIPVCCSKVERE